MFHNMVSEQIWYPPWRFFPLHFSWENLIFSFLGFFSHSSSFSFLLFLEKILFSQFSFHLRISILILFQFIWSWFIWCQFFVLDHVFKTTNSFLFVSVPITFIFILWFLFRSDFVLRFSFIAILFLLQFSRTVVLLLDWIPISCSIHLLHISRSLNLYCNCSLEHRFRFRAIVAKNCRSGVVSLPVSVQFYCRFFSRLATANHIRASFFIHRFNILSDWCFVIWLILYKWLKCAVSWLVGSFSDIQESLYGHSSLYLIVHPRCLWKVLYWRQRRIVLCCLIKSRFIVCFGV
jgi:hypothetical protein